MTPEELAAARDYLPSAEECREIVREIQAALFHLAWLGTNDDNDGDTVCRICMVLTYHGMITGVSENELTCDLGSEHPELLKRNLPREIIPFLKSAPKDKAEETEK